MLAKWFSNRREQEREMGRGIVLGPLSPELWKIQGGTAQWHKTPMGTSWKVLEIQSRSRNLKAMSVSVPGQGSLRLQPNNTGLSKEGGKRGSPKCSLTAAVPLVKHAFHMNHFWTELGHNPPSLSMTTWRRILVWVTGGRRLTRQKHCAFSPWWTI